jgi:hypothetical protein
VGAEGPSCPWRKGSKERRSIKGRNRRKKGRKEGGREREKEGREGRKITCVSKRDRACFAIFISTEGRKEVKEVKDGRKVKIWRKTRRE